MKVWEACYNKEISDRYEIARKNFENFEKDKNCAHIYCKYCSLYNVENCSTVIREADSKNLFSEAFRTESKKIYEAWESFSKDGNCSKLSSCMFCHFSEENCCKIPNSKITEILNEEYSSEDGESDEEVGILSE